MKWIIAVFIALLAAVAVGLIMHIDAGYVLISYNHWTVETTVWMLIFAIFILYALFFILWRIFYGVGTFSKKIREWSLRRRLLRSQKLFRAGFGNWCRTKWLTAEKRLNKSAQSGDLALPGYLLAADAAAQQGRIRNRDEYLNRALKAAPKNTLEIAFVRAKLQMQAGQYEQALANLKLLQQKLPRNLYILRLLQEAYTKTEDWETLAKLLPALHKHKAYFAPKLLTLERDIYGRLLYAADNAAAATEVWNTMPAMLQKDPELLYVYTDVLLRNNSNSLAEPLLVAAINKNWHGKLLLNYSRVHSAVPSHQIAVAETWLRKHSEDPILLLCLGKLCKRQKLWGKAQSYLETSAKIAPNSVVYIELGCLMEALGNQGSALHYYKQAVISDI